MKITLFVISTIIASVIGAPPPAVDLKASVSTAAPSNSRSFIPEEIPKLPSNQPPLRFRTYHDSIQNATDQLGRCFSKMSGFIDVSELQFRFDSDSFLSNSHQLKQDIDQVGTFVRKLIPRRIGRTPKKQLSNKLKHIEEMYRVMQEASTDLTELRKNKIGPYQCLDELVQTRVAVLKLFTLSGSKDHNIPSYESIMARQSKDLETLEAKIISDGFLTNEQGRILNKMTGQLKAVFSRLKQWDSKKFHRVNDYHFDLGLW
ncbi:hypothetical protein JCM33374_g4164 [Metschnikowia sp. JCM 33374]|nr:hypothetical protein JCM33374_g4164 [Metschnikowia sp. JCM 33374]